jgi:O-antigen/teichoic acid export membrane protein
MTFGSIIRNTYWNLLGSAVPILAALFAIPPLLRALGFESFGILAIGWAVMGYFALFDLGLGRATTKFVSEHLERKQAERVAETVWSSLVAHAALGFVGGGLFALIAPWLVHDVFSISPALQPEALGSFYWLAAAIPIIVASACMRGVLEAFRRFDLVNLIRIPASSINYLAPLPVFLFFDNLIAVVAVISLARLLVFAAYLCTCLVAIPSLRRGVRVSYSAMKPLLGFGLPVTVSSLVMPIILFSDRFIIAILHSIETVTYYVTPYEVVTKLWIFSASLLGAMFPVLSALSVSRTIEIEILSRRAFLLLLAVVTPIVGIILALGRELLVLWVGVDFAAQSGTVAKWLAVGVLVNVLAQVPFTVLQCVGRPDIVARLQVIQLPIYLALAWWLANAFGTVGIAMAWALRAFLDAALMLMAALRVVSFNRADWRASVVLAKGFPIASFLAVAWLIDKLWRFDPSIEVPVFGVVFATFIVWEWFVLLGPTDKKELTSSIRALTRARA